jgi:hypothetical protein
MGSGDRSTTRRWEGLEGEAPHLNVCRIVAVTLEE